MAKPKVDKLPNGRKFRFDYEEWIVITGTNFDPKVKVKLEDKSGTCTLGDEQVWDTCSATMVVVKATPKKIGGSNSLLYFWRRFFRGHHRAGDLTITVTNCNGGTTTAACIGLASDAVHNTVDFS